MRHTKLPLSAPAPVVDPEVRARELAQRHADDVVYAAARFKPNAAGNHELSWGGFGQRQILKAGGAYIAERVILAITPLEIYAIEVFLLARVQRVARRWSRAGISVSCVPARGRPMHSDWPALRIETATGRSLVEVQALHRDVETTRVINLLLAAGRREDYRG